jgi:hypothetical protein
MATPDPKAMIDGMLRPWHEAVENPAPAQAAVLRRLLGIYACTDYGAEHGAGQVSDLEGYRRAFPIVTYDEIKPLIQRVMAGETRLLLDEPPVGWAITRGTTQGESKLVPMTPNDMRLRVSAGRAMLNYVASTGRLDLFQGVNLNLNFPSRVGTIRVGDRDIEYGYSSGI